LYSASSAWLTGAAREGQAPTVELDGEQEWCVRVGDESQRVLGPRARRVGSRASSHGADTGSVLSSFGIER
jgi:hypothetical protein